MSKQSDSPISMSAGAALNAFTLVKFHGTNVVNAGAGDPFIGVLQNTTTAIGDHASVRDKKHPGTCKVTANGAIAAGALFYPAASGKVSAVPSGGAIGQLLEAATADGDICEAILFDQYPEFQDMVFEEVADNKTLDAEDVGKVLYVTADAKTITLPATAANFRFVIMNGAADGTVAVTISPGATDKIMGPDLAGVDNKDRINTKLTAKRGDFTDLNGDGADGYYVYRERGTWAAEA